MAETKNSEHLRSNGPFITIDDFITEFDTIEPTARYNLLTFPQDKYAKLLARQHVETSILQLPSLEIVIAKGLSGTEAAFTREELLQLNPQLKVHTHPTRLPSPGNLKILLANAGISEEDADIEGLSHLALLIPSPEDFTLGSVGAERNEIWTEYGKTTYQPYRTDSENLIHLSRKTIANLYRSKLFLSVLADKSLDMQTKIDKLNQPLKAMDISFQVTPWEKDEE